jgi:hypothetical protein
MIPTAPPPTYPVGTRLRIVQHVRIGSHRWATQIVGTVEGESLRPLGGIEMGAKSRFGFQPTLVLRLQDDELTTVALDDRSEVYVLS